jgi:hypothetical protein
MLRDDNFPGPFQVEMKSSKSTACFLAFKTSVDLHDDNRTDKEPTSPGGSSEEITVRFMSRCGNEDRGINEKVHCGD